MARHSRFNLVSPDMSAQVINTAETGHAERAVIFGLDLMDGGDVTLAMALLDKCGATLGTFVFGLSSAWAGPLKQCRQKCTSNYGCWQ